MADYAVADQKETSPAGRDSKQKNRSEDSSTRNPTGIPGTMKSQFEQYSGFSFDDVRVHYSSGRPKQFNAVAYTKGNDVHLSLGQEKHLGHELGHVVQQKQNRVRPNLQFKGLGMNQEESLEREADAIAGQAFSTPSYGRPPAQLRIAGASDAAPAQMMMVGRIQPPRPDGKQHIVYDRYKREGWKLLYEIKNTAGQADPAIRKPMDTKLSTLLFENPAKERIYKLLEADLKEDKKVEVMTFILKESGKLTDRQAEKLFTALVCNPVNDQKKAKVFEIIQNNLEDDQKIKVITYLFSIPANLTTLQNEKLTEELMKKNELLKEEEKTEAVVASLNQADDEKKQQLLDVWKEDKTEQKSKHLDLWQTEDTQKKQELLKLFNAEKLETVACIKKQWNLDNEQQKTKIEDLWKKLNKDIKDQTNTVKLILDSSTGYMNLGKVIREKLEKNLTDEQKKKIYDLLKPFEKSQESKLYDQLGADPLVKQKKMAVESIGQALSEDEKKHLLSEYTADIDLYQKWKLVTESSFKIDDLIRKGEYVQIKNMNILDNHVSDSNENVFKPRAHQDPEHDDQHKFQAFKHIAETAAGLMPNYDAGPHIALSKVNNVMYIAINSNFDTKSKAKKAKNAIKKVDYTIDVQSLPSAYQFPLPDVLGNPHWDIRNVPNSQLEDAVKLGITNLAKAGSQIAGEPRELEYMQYLERKMNSAGADKLEFKVLKMNKSYDPGSIHGEMIIAEYLSNLALQRNKAAKLTEIKGTSPDEVYRVIRFGGTLLDCNTCHKRFLGGTYEEKNGTKKIKQYPTNTPTSTVLKWCYGTPQTMFSDTYSERLSQSNLKSVVRSAGTSGVSFPNVINRDKTGYFASF